MRTSLRTTMLTLGLALGTAAACSDDAGPVDPAMDNFAPALNVNLSAMTRTTSGLYILDEVAGTGAIVNSGASVTVDYTGWLTNGEMFDTSSGAAPITVTNIGNANVIRGWNEGLIGMRVGGRRLLVIPSQLGYGSAGRGPIPPHANLVFRVELRSVQ